MKPFLFILLLVIVLIIEIKCQLLQLVKPYSINMRKGNASLIASSSYYFERDVKITSESFKLTKNDTKSYGRIITKDDLNLTEFEYQIDIKMNNELSAGSMFGIWFYNNKTEDNSHHQNEFSASNSFFGFTNKFNGFGIAGVTLPGDDPNSVSTRISLISNDIANHYNMSDKISDLCNIILRRERFRLIIKYSYETVSVEYNNKLDLNTHCFSASMTNFNSSKFKIAITAFNGFIDNIQYQDNIDVFKISLFSKQRDTISSNSSNSILNKTIADLVDKFYISNNHSQALSIGDLNKEIDNAIVHLSTIQSGKGSELNLNRVSDSLNQLSAYLINLTMLLNNTHTHATLSQTNFTQAEKIKMLSLELDVLLDKWTYFKDALKKSNEINQDIQNNITELQNNILLAQNMNLFIGDTIAKKVLSISKNIDKKIERNSLYHYFLIGLFIVGMALSIRIYQKIKMKQKQS